MLKQSEEKILILECKKTLLASIKSYELCAQPLKMHRAQDVAYFRGLIYQKYETIDALIEAIESHLPNMFTGFLFFKTGRSRLRNLIIASLADYKDECFRTKSLQEATDLASLLGIHRSESIDIFEGSDEEESQKPSFSTNRNLISPKDYFNLKKAKDCMSFYAKNPSFTRHEILLAGELEDNKMCTMSASADLYNLFLKDRFKK